MSVLGCDLGDPLSSSVVEVSTEVIHYQLVLDARSLELGFLGDQVLGETIQVGVGDKVIHIVAEH